MGFVYLLREQMRVAFGFYARLSADERRAYASQLLARFRRLDADEAHFDEFAKTVALLIANVFWPTYVDTGE